MTDGFQQFEKQEKTWAVEVPREVTVVTPEGEVEAEEGDYLAIDSRGYLYPIAKEEFENIYQPAEPETQNAVSAEGEVTIADDDEEANSAGMWASAEVVAFDDHTCEGFVDIAGRERDGFITPTLTSHGHLDEGDVLQVKYKMKGVRPIVEEIDA